MRRSEVDGYIAEAAEFFAEQGFLLPPFAKWTPEEWGRLGSEGDGLRVQRLGWDVTDFHSGEFEALGLTLFTLRNGLGAGGRETKPYAEKIMMVREGQVTPLHYHRRKTEDIINRGGAGRLVVQVYNSGAAGLADGAVVLGCDGIERRVEAGGTVVLGPGESVTLTPGVFHTFHAVDGVCMVGEVSSVNDDDTDNYFLEALPRYAEIVEDAPARYRLCTEYGI